MCIPNRFTVLRGSLVDSLLPRELRWEEVVHLTKELHSAWPELG